MGLWANAFLALVVCLSCAGSLPAQSGATAAAPVISERIIDVEAARRAKKGEHGFKFYQVPLLPLLVLDRGMKKGLGKVDRDHLLQKASYYLAEREKGFQPLFGGLGVGTGLTMGVRYYNNNFLGTGTRLSIPARVSSLRYQEYGASVSVPMAKERIFFDGGAFYRVRTQDDFFGLGERSSLGGRSSYMLKSREFLFGPRFRLGRRVELSTQFGYRGTDVFDGKDRAFPTITELHDRRRVPGLLDGAREWLGGLELAHEARDLPGRPKKGGYHRFGVRWYGSADEKDFGYWRYEAEAQRFIPLGSRYRTLALRFLGITNQARGGSAVPFFEQAMLGGSQTMRGFREFRFYDLSAILMTAEYRYGLNSFMDFVVFMDQGQVAREPGDFSWRGLRASYGAGIRFLSQTGTPLKIMVGRSNEGTRIYFSMGPTF